MKLQKKIIIFTPMILILVLLTAGGIWFKRKYATSVEMNVHLKEYSQLEYPEDPANRSVHYAQYSNRNLKIVKRDKTHFDLLIEPTNDHTAKIAFKDVDAGLFVTDLPEWTKKDKDLEIIALTDREWNRQEVSFGPDSRHIEITSGDGFEKNNLHSAAIAKNCLNAGLWEILLFTKENGQKALYYQGWFTFPLGQYKDVFEEITGLSYWKYRRRLEHWVDPAGSSINLKALRKVLHEREVQAEFLAQERIYASGEQVRKLRNTNFQNVITWKDFCGSSVEFATFAPPGKYYVEKPWKSEYWRIAEFKEAILRDIQSPASEEVLQEIELVFKDSKTAEINRFFISGFKLNRLPQLPVEDYPQGLYMPMGIGVPPFFLSYEDLKRNPPDKSPYFSVLLDSHDKWINHHEVAIDGPVLHRDMNNPNLIHVYLLSYERHSLVGHFLLKI